MNSPDLGGWIVERILHLAAFFFTSESAPGWMSLGLVTALVWLSMWHFLSASRLCRAVSAAGSILQAGNGHITGERLTVIDAGFRNLKSVKKKGPRHRLAVVWEEFRETTIPPVRETDRLSNTVRPTAFFHREELGLDRGIWRQIPALFVSVGLFLTFLGLVAALDQTGRILDGATAGGDGAATDGLKTLLRIASTKFIMSLTGLLCSILFTLVLRYDARRTDEALHALCDDIENGCIFLSEQTILGKMLEQAREQTDHLKSFSTELVAQIATPLREDLPNTIREAMQQAMAPVVENISRGTSEGVETLVGNVSGQLTEGIQASVFSMNKIIEEVRGSLETVADRLDRSAGAMGGHMDEAVQSLARQIDSLETAMSGSSREAARTFSEAADALLRQMNDALQSIRSTSADGAQRIGDASRVMVDAAEALSQFVRGSVTAATEASGHEIERAGQEMASGIAAATATMRDSLLDPMNSLVERVQGLASGVETATGRIGEYAESVENSTTAIVSANEGLGRSAETLTAATTPVRDVVVGIESATRTMGDRVETASEAMRRTTEHTEAVMRGTREAIEASRSTMLGAAGSLEHAVTEFREVLDRYREIDQSLGDAFGKIETAVRSSIDEIGTFERKLNEEFGKALNRLEAVIAQAEPFTPRRVE